MGGRKILVGVTGGIAAYKSAELVRLLIRQGHQVRVVMTAGARAFVQPMTFQALSGHTVRDSLLDPEAEAGMGHIELARWADMILVAPASADFMARMAAGLADDLLTTLCLASAAPVVLAPAMNQGMWRNYRTRRNRSLLEDDPQIRIWGPAEGDQACGDVGPGRMVEPEVIAEQVAAFWDRPWEGLRLVMTAGPTREALDPVRYISNESSGKMGYALARAAAEAGARVTLVSGPVALPAPEGVERVSVSSAESMLAAVNSAIDGGCDVFVAAAAVADYRPETVASDKIKKSRESLVIQLTRNPDILATVAARSDRPFCVGFAAETRDVEHYAEDKLKRKNLDMIVANDVSDASIGFNSEHNAVTVLWPGGRHPMARTDKLTLARALLAVMLDRYRHRGA